MDKDKTGYLNTKCYLSFSRDCCRKITDEHFIPKSLLKLIQQQGDKLFLKNMSWLEKDEIKELQPSNFQSRILCERHNNYFSRNIDPEITSFFKTVRDSRSIKEEEITFNGFNLELSLLKVFCGILISRNLNIKVTPIKNNRLELKWLKILLKEVEWPDGWGMYLKKEIPVPENKFWITPMWNEQSNKIIGAEFGIGGMKFILALHKPLRGQSNDPLFINTLYRPLEIILNQNASDEKILKLNWTSN